MKKYVNPFTVFAAWAAAWITIVMLCLVNTGCQQVEQKPAVQGPSLCEPGVRLYIFTSRLCVECDRMKEAHNVLAKYPNVRVIDVDERPLLVKRYGITQLPAYMVVDREDRHVVHYSLKDIFGSCKGGKCG